MFQIDVILHFHNEVTSVFPSFIPLTTSKMGVLHLANPATYISDSRPRLITTSMISEPLSPDLDSDFGDGALPTTVLPALEYISNKLGACTHLTFLVGCSTPLPIAHQSELTLAPIAPLDQQIWRTLHRIVQKATRKFSLGPAWSNALQRSQQRQSLNENCNEYLIRQSILQNDVLFSQEGLTLLSIDRLYTIKCRLHAYSRGLARENGIPDHLYIKSCVRLLRQTVADYKGRQFSLAFFTRIYKDLAVPEHLLVEVANEYQAKYGRAGIVLPQKKPSPAAPPKEQQQARPPQKKRKNADGIKRLAPRTPLSASDVTPITQGEWQMLLNSQALLPNRNNTLQVPFPVKPVGA
ncbi:hypothetical protein BDBG_08061 [Blastomyces gilchristii SLH14081]|uniref:DUF7582 domain-containing protein n=1 Tax=Blastomyces gilchristii (strain SLH14081) TaxID=559298 RepID=A0A179UY31_BLAGS|nr:uncharacterized protein BDBG_08061 [Blastomyces gilchristii SLH14081]OAT12750.1 hypothetical protein BDBG_08061 [Blastomyces gilchristii SLH14081]